jgi:hypothetical protein
MTGLAGPRRPGRVRPTFHRVTVAEASHLTPRMRRLVFAGDDLAGYLSDGPGAHFKLVLPLPGQDEIRLPKFTGEGLRWPDGPRPVLRTYTPRTVDWAERRLTVDFALHPDGGPASAWAAAARPGAVRPVPRAFSATARQPVSARGGRGVDGAVPGGGQEHAGPVPWPPRETAPASSATASPPARDVSRAGAQSSLRSEEPRSVLGLAAGIGLCRGAHIRLAMVS